MDDFFDVEDLWSRWLPINGAFIWAMSFGCGLGFSLIVGEISGLATQRYTPPETDDGIRTVSFWKIVRWHRSIS